MDHVVSFGEAYLRGGFTPPIPYDQVRNLALEGGGGKGNAYLGALIGLDQLGVLDKLETVSGSSAGAITALALSLGMRPKDVYGFIKTTDFAAFFDPVSDAVPEVRHPYRRGEDRVLRGAVQLEWQQLLVLSSLQARIYMGLQSAVEGLGTLLARGVGEVIYRAEDLVYVMRALSLGPGAGPRPVRPTRPSRTPKPLPAQVLDQVLESLPAHFTSLSLDSGLFSGEAARDVLANLIAERMGSTTRDGRSVTFAELDAFCKEGGHPRLRVTGSEMCRLRSVIFSGGLTPEFPVADAVRISMGLPLIYKPYTIRRALKGWPACGVYVDGGVFCNLPLIAFDDDEVRQAIGIRLEVEKPTRIEGVLGMVLQVLKASMFAGESSVTDDRAGRCIRLDTEPLGLFDFSTDLATLSRVAARAHLTTMLFFGQESAFKPMDVETGTPVPERRAKAEAQATRADLETSIALRKERAACVYD